MASKGNSSSSNSNSFKVVNFPKNAPKSEKELVELDKNLKSNTTALLQLKGKRDELKQKIEKLEDELQGIILDRKQPNNTEAKKEKLKAQGIKKLRNRKILEQHLLNVNQTIKNLLNVRKIIEAQLPKLSKLEGGGLAQSKPKQNLNKVPDEYIQLLLERVDLTIKILEIDDKLPIDETELTDEMKQLILQKRQLEQKKIQLDATIEFMTEEIYTEKEKAERERARQAKNAQLEAELKALLEEGDQGPQTGGKQYNKVLSKQIGNTIKPQDEYYGKLYLEDNMLYYYDMNYNKVLTDKIPIISIPKLEKLLKEYKKKNTLSNSNNNKTNKGKKGNTNKKKKTQKRKL
jgi:hypothetical protein